MQKLATVSIVDAIGDVLEFDSRSIVWIAHACGFKVYQAQRTTRRGKQQSAFSSQHSGSDNQPSVFSTEYADSGKPVMRIPLWPLWRIFRPINKAVMLSRIRAFSSLPPSMARTPGIFTASARISCVAFESSLQTMTS